MSIYCYLHIVVGSQERKGISGGQRRRVSVAIEMMKEADMFLLDGMIRDCRKLFKKNNYLYEVWQCPHNMDGIAIRKMLNLTFNRNEMRHFF